ncbi:MAG: DUF2232 domain-containing protein [Clostridia bacterium]|nr:DUF2232 domain-containing protein [Clostridia bacterium]
MKFELKNNKSYQKTVLFSFLMALLFSTLTILFGEIFLPFSSAFLAVLLTVEGDKRKFSLIAASVTVVLSFIPGSFPSTLGIATVIIAFALSLMYRAEFAKCDIAMLLTLIFSASIILSVFFMVFKITDEYSFEYAFNYMKELYTTFRDALAKQMVVSYSAIPEMSELGFTEQIISDAIDSLANYLISFILIVAFLLTGITLKLFGFVLSRLHSEPEQIRGWRFVTPSAFAYFYIVLFLVSTFMMGNSVIEVAVLNLSNLFAVIYAYIGLKSAYSMLRSKRSAVFSSVILTLALFVFSGFAINVLSVLGVVFTIRYNAQGSKGNSDGNFMNL